MPTTYSTIQLLQSLESLHRPPRFLLDTFFPGVVTFSTKEVGFDSETDNLELAPFVSPVVAGKADKTQGFQTKTFAPAYVKPKNEIDPSIPLIRRPGEAFGGALTAGDRRNLVINETMAKQRDRIIRRMEWMAAQALTTGKIIVTGDDFPTTEVNFSRAAGHTKALSGGARWGETGVVPSANLDGWMDEIGEAVGAGVDVVVMGKDAWKYQAQDEKFMAMLDREHGQNNLIQLGYQTGMPGTPQFKGTVGDVSFYTYNGIYKDSAGTTQKMLDSHGVILAATGAHAGRQLYGAILDGTAGYQPYQFFPKNWVENDPGVEFVMTQSAPLVAPGRPEAVMYVKVR